MAKNRQNQKKNALIQPRCCTKKVWGIVLVAAILLTISFIVAPTLSNQKNYDYATKTATIQDVAGQNIAKVRLLSEEHRYILPGDYVAEIEIESYEERIPIDSVEFYRKDNAYSGLGDKIESTDFTYKYYDPTYQYQESYYECNLGGKNGTECEYVRKERTKTGAWRDFNEKSILPRGKIKVRMYYSNIQPGETIEWIPTMFGTKIEEWADFTLTFEQDYFNQTSDGNNFIQSNAWRGQQFNASNTYDLYGIGLEIYKVGDGSTLWVILKPVNSTGGTNQTNLSTGFIDGRTFETGSGYWYNVTMSAYELTKGTNYTIAVWTNDSDGSNYLRWTLDNYNWARGTNLNSADGIAWTVVGGETQLFKVYGTLDEESITVELSPETAYTSSNTSIILNATLTPNLLNLTNATYYIYSSATSLFNQTFVEVTSNESIANTTSVTFSTNPGSYIWNVYGCAANSTDTLCSFAANNTFTVGFETNYLFYNVTTYETADETFLINYTFSSSDWSVTAANLNFNGTNYAATADGTDIYKRTIQMDSVVGLKAFYWNFTLSNGTGTAYATSNTSNVNVTAIHFELCNATYTVPYINITFQNEADLSSENATISTSTWVYSLGSSMVYNNSLLFINTTAENPSYAFCFSPADRSVNVDYTISYASPGYPQRTYNPSTEVLTNTTTSKTLQLLETADGIYVTFQITNTANEPLSEVYMNATRDVGAETGVLVGEGTSGADGGVTLWLNPDFVHTFSFSRTGYDTYTTSFAPTQTQYTVVLGATTNTTIYDYNRGISYTILPGNNSLENQTAYDFQFILSSSYWDVTEFGFVLSNHTDDLGSTSESTNGGTATLNFNTGNHTEIFMNYYWVINDTYMNGTRFWAVVESGGTGWSIRNFFTDLKNFITADLFGLDNFGLALICFLSIFLIGGIMSYKFGITSPATILGIIFGLTLFLNIGVDIIPLGSSPVRYFPTIFMGLIFVGTLFREVTT